MVSRACCPRFRCMSARTIRCSTSRRSEAAHVKPGASAERAVILAPMGRDAALAAGLIREGGFHANIFSDLSALDHEVERGAGVAVIADEAIKTADLRA